ncbi:MAG: hypothetical protein AB8H79_21250 [Myxococcota bacterium]
MDQLIAVRGHPIRLDKVFRPMARAGLLLIGVACSALLWWLEFWFWVPIPLVVAHFTYELIFFVRGDRPVKVSLIEQTLRVHDPKGKHSFSTEIDQAHSASVAIRHGDRGRVQAFFVLHSKTDVLVALRLITTHLDWPDHAVPLEALQPVFGGNAGIVRHLAPVTASARQILKDDEGKLARALLTQVPPEAWNRAAVRAWVGKSPPTDFMGFHTGPPDHLLVFDGDRIHVTDPTTGAVRAVPITGNKGGRASREVQVMTTPGEPLQTVELPVVVWQLGKDITLVIPSIHAGRHGKEMKLRASFMHTHLGEGAIAAWWLLKRLPAGQLPNSLLLGLRDALITTQEPHPVLAKHSPSTE